MGENIFTSNGANWKRSRQALQPAFHLRHVERYTQIMIDSIERELRDWQPGPRRRSGSGHDSSHNDYHRRDHV